LQRTMAGGSKQKVAMRLEEKLLSSYHHSCSTKGQGVGQLLTSE
jgi:predicted  nucleic acid-binding Zn-ribbon protein